MNEFKNLYEFLNGVCLEFFNRWYWKFQCECDFTYYEHESKSSLIYFQELTTSMQRGVVFDFFDFSGMLLSYKYIRELEKYQITLSDKKTGLHLVNYLEYKNLKTVNEAAIKLIELANNLYNNNDKAMTKVCKHKLLINKVNGLKDCIICGEQFYL